MKKLVTFLALLALILPFSALNMSCSQPLPSQGTQLKAAIIDQLGDSYPNPQFIQGVTQQLETDGFNVTIFRGDQITVDLYEKLPAYGFQLIIFRVHSAVITDNKAFSGTTCLFTSEPYSKSKYVTQQLTGQIGSARYDENSPLNFAVSSDFISKLTQGRFNKTLIVMMGCNSLVSTDMAEAFISRGALMYTGWTASVKLDFVDGFTEQLINNLSVKGDSFKEALYQTANEKGIDPTYNAVFGYYPAENENYSLKVTN